ncbi:MAG: hypothetical protein U0T81_09425 [Saprospiraceae bacterium]
MYFTRTVSEGGHKSESKIYASGKTSGGWSPAIEVSGVNGDFLSSHPCEGELFGSKVLFFSSNMPGGKGGMDLYYATQTGEAQFSAPVNLSALNTVGDDITPFYLDGTLYFASDGWPSFGGLDIFLRNGMARNGHSQPIWESHTTPAQMNSLTALAAMERKDSWCPTGRIRNQNPLKARPAAMISTL